MSFLICFLDDLSINVLLSFSLLLFWLYLTYVLGCSYGGCVYVYNYCIFFLGWSLDHYVVSFFVFLNGLYSNIYFVSCEYCHCPFPLIHMCMDSPFPFLHFQSVFVPRPEADLLKTTCIQVLCFYPFSQSVSFGAVNLFMFKVIIDIHVLITIFGNCFGFVSVGLSPSFPLFPSSLVIWWLTLVSCLSSFFFICVCICCIGLAKVLMWICLKTWMNSLANRIDFWFQDTMRFWYSSLYINEVALSCWSFNSKCISKILHFCSPLSQLLLFISYLCANDFTPFQ